MQVKDYVQRCFSYCAQAAKVENLPSSLHVMATPSSAETPSRKANVNANMKRLKMTGESTYLCFTPTLTLKLSDSSPHKATRASIPLWNALSITVKCDGHRKLSRLSQSSSRLTESNALCRSGRRYTQLQLHKAPSESLLSLRATISLSQRESSAAM